MTEKEEKKFRATIDMAAVESPLSAGRIKSILEFIDVIFDASNNIEKKYPGNNAMTAKIFISIMEVLENKIDKLDPEIFKPKDLTVN